MNEHDYHPRTELTEISERGMMDRLAEREHAFGIVSMEQLKTPQDRLGQYSRLEKMIGSTPLDSMRLENGVTIWLKRESENPTESHYDRVSVAILKRLEMKGFVKPGDRILEGTSGSAGRSFAWACSRLGFKLDIVVPHADEIPSERVKDMKAFGANVIHADEHGGIGKVTKKFRQIVVDLKNKGYQRKNCVLEGTPVIIFKRGKDTVIVPNHSENIITPSAFRAIAEEVVAQLPKGAKINVFISTLGNGSTLKGISEGLRAAYGNVEIIGVEHRNSPTNAVRKLRKKFGEEKMREEFEKIYGFKMPEREEMTYHDSFGASTPGYEPPFVEIDKIDGIVLVGDEWRDYKRRVNTYAWRHGNPRNLIGNTTAENLYTALMLAKRQEMKGKSILVINYDKADQYADWPPQVRTYQHPLGKPKPEEIPYSVLTLKLGV
ncbi:MAG: pyridoxal-phosphate dependent enzyme [Candidatus Levybacteria bacterium]|nr:pyridoxal-phosphate dependent enzyme [Candidatus Levybacteria bacterium]